MWLSEKVALRSKTEERTRQVAFAARAHHNEAPSGPERGLVSSCGATKAVDTPAEPKTPQKSSPAASQGARAAQDAADAAPGTLTRRRQPVLARGCSSPRVGARSTLRRPARDRGRASPGHPSAAPHRWRLGDDSPLDSADRRQIVSTARACGPAARSSAGASRADILVLVVTKKSSN